MKVLAQIVSFSWASFLLPEEQQSSTEKKYEVVGNFRGPEISPNLIYLFSLLFYYMHTSTSPNFTETDAADLPGAVDLRATSQLSKDSSQQLF